MSKVSEQTFFQRRYSNGQQVHEKLLNITNHQGNSNRNHNEKSPHTCKNVYQQKDQITSSGEDVAKRKQKILCTAGMIVIGTATMENSMEVPQKTKNRTTI